jgi:hypothetical protein
VCENKEEEEEEKMKEYIYRMGMEWT